MFGFYYLVICKCMSTTVSGNGTVQFTFFFIMGLNFTIITSCDSLIVMLVLSFSSSLSLKMDWSNTSETSLKYNMDLSN